MIVCPARSDTTSLARPSMLRRLAHNSRRYFIRQRDLAMPQRIARLKQLQRRTQRACESSPKIVVLNLSRFFDG